MNRSYSRKFKPPKRISPLYLQRLSRYYLEKYSPSIAQFRRYLLQKVNRSIKHHYSDNPEQHSQKLEEAHQWVEDEIKRRMDLKQLDDWQYTESQINRFQRQGLSQSAIKNKLYQKGISSSLIQKGLNNLKEDREDSALEATLRYARRRGIGPFRSSKILDPEKQKKHRLKDLSSFLRAGHSYDLAQKVLNCEDRASADLLLLSLS